jgi:serine protease inhibitor
MDKLNAYSNDVDTVVAKSIEDAWTVWCETTGEEKEDYINEVDFYMLDETTQWTIENFDGCENTKTQTLKKWIEENGRGFLSSTEY